MDIKSLVSNVIATCILILLFLLAFTWIFFDFYNTSSSLKDSLSIVSSLFGGIATLAAAYIASKLFNDWKEQHNKQVDSDFIMKLYDCLFEMRQSSTNCVGFMRDFIAKKDDKPAFMDHLKEHNYRLCSLIDFSTLKLSDVAYVITVDDYNEKFLPQITYIANELHELHALYISFLQSDDPNTVKVTYKGQERLDLIDQVLENSLVDLNDRFRSFMVELKKYYKA